MNMISKHIATACYAAYMHPSAYQRLCGPSARLMLTHWTLTGFGLQTPTLCLRCRSSACACPTGPLFYPSNFTKCDFCRKSYLKSCSCTLVWHESRMADRPPPPEVDSLLSIVCGPSPQYTHVLKTGTVGERFVTDHSTIVDTINELIIACPFSGYWCYSADTAFVVVECTKREHGCHLRHSDVSKRRSECLRSKPGFYHFHVP